jgi:hypothetical protein
VAIPNEGILLDTLSLQEAKSSSAIENIITTHDELFNAELNLGVSQAAKEVQRYAVALRMDIHSVKVIFNLQIENQYSDDATAQRHAAPGCSGHAEGSSTERCCLAK